MKKTLRILLICVLIGLFTVGITMAEGLVQTIQVIINTVNFEVDGEEAKLDNLLYNEEIYVPINSTGEILGKDVEWDKENNLVKISDKGNIESDEDESNETEKEIIKVKTTKEFLEAIGSNRTIILSENNYDLLGSKVENEYIRTEEVFDGEQLIIQGVNNLDIIGEEGENVQLLVEPRYANVITFKDVQNINISNIIAGHTPDKGYCTGGVLYFEDSKNIEINNSVLFGCGTEGISLFNVENFTSNDSTIKECSYDIMTIVSSNNITFNNSKFHDNEEFSLINVSSSNEVTLNNCFIYDNECIIGDYLFNVDPISEVFLKNCFIYNNKVLDFEKHINSVNLENTFLGDNLFRLKKEGIKDIKDYLFNLSDEDLEKAINRGKKLTGYGYDDYRIDWTISNGYRYCGEDINGNRYGTTYIDDIELITPYSYIETLSYFKTQKEQLFTLEQARDIYERFIADNQIIIIANFYGKKYEDINNAKIKVVQAATTIKADITVNESYRQVKYYSFDTEMYERFTTITINVNDIDLSKELTIYIWPNGDKNVNNPLGVYNIDFNNYR